MLAGSSSNSVWNSATRFTDNKNKRFNPRSLYMLVDSLMSSLWDCNFNCIVTQRKQRPVNLPIIIIVALQLTHISFESWNVLGVDTVFDSNFKNVSGQNQLSFVCRDTSSGKETNFCC
uniref:Uncharacterized protein n=1 Tax=Megaselia scalaris TaxID=36166 RepID=T1GB28_MEGSC